MFSSIFFLPLTSLPPQYRVVEQAIVLRGITQGGKRAYCMPNISFIAKAIFTAAFCAISASFLSYWLCQWVG